MTKHGTRSHYIGGCRCTLCRKANREYYKLKPFTPARVLPPRQIWVDGFRDFEQEHRERNYRYNHARMPELRKKARDRYRLKHNIPLDAPVRPSRRILYT